MNKKKILLAAFVLASLYVTALSFKDVSDIPPLQDGDIIFQSDLSSQVLPVAAATLSLYTHTGIIKKTDHGYTVIQAIDIVRETPLEQWIAQGMFKRFAVYRFKDLSPVQGKAIVAAAKKYYGRRYDIYFYFDDSQIYCSELPYLSYKDAGILLGEVQKISALNLDNRFTRKLIEQRWQGYPVCKGHNYTFNQCYDVIMSGQIITPVSIADDKHMELLYSNYRL